MILAVYQQKVQIYTHIYPLWDIAFARVFDYSGSQEDTPAGVTGW
jgi:hypothetical protein